MTNAAKDERPRPTRSDLRVRTLRVATGAHFLSFVTGSDASGPSFAEELGRLPRAGDLVINVNGLSIDDARAVETMLRDSARLKGPRGRIIIVCEQASIRRVFELSGLGWLVLIEHSLDDAFRYVLGHAWLSDLVAIGLAGRSRNA
jgi:anti-anti-sigma regulatory factor